MANLSFNIDANTAPAQAAVGALGKTFDQLAKEMLGVVEAGKRAGDTNEQIASQISRAYGVPLDKARDGVKQIDNVLKEAGQTGSRAADDIEQGLEGVSQQARRAGDDIDHIGSSPGGGLGQLKGTAREVSQDIGQNFSQAVTSAKGNLSELGQFGQGTLGDLAGTVAGLGPAGFAGAAGLGVAATAVGILVAKLQEAEARRKELEGNASDLAQSYIEAANGGASALDHMIDRLKDMATAADDGETNLEDLRLAADKSGNSYRDLAQVYAGNLDGLDELISKGETRTQQLRDEADAVDTTSQAEAGRYGSLLKQIDAQTQYVQFVKDAADVAAQAARDQENFNRSGAQDLLDQQERIQGLQATQAERLASDKQYIDEIAGAWQDAATDASDYYETAEDGSSSFNASSYLADAEATLAAMNDYKSKIVGLPPEIQAEGERVLADAGAQAAAAYANAYVSASDSDKGRFSAAAAANGSAAGQAAADALAATASTALSKFRPPDMVVKAVVDDSAVRFYYPPRKVGTVEYRAQTKWDVP